MAYIIYYFSTLQCLQIISASDVSLMHMEMTEDSLYRGAVLPTPPIYR